MPGGLGAQFGFPWLGTGRTGTEVTVWPIVDTFEILPLPLDLTGPVAGRQVADIFDILLPFLVVVDVSLFAIDWNNDDLFGVTIGLVSCDLFFAGSTFVAGMSLLIDVVLILLNSFDFEMLNLKKIYAFFTWNNQIQMHPKRSEN